MDSPSPRQHGTGLGTFLAERGRARGADDPRHSARRRWGMMGLGVERPAIARGHGGEPLESHEDLGIRLLIGDVLPRMRPDTFWEGPNSADSLTRPFRMCRLDRVGGPGGIPLGCESPGQPWI